MGAPTNAGSSSHHGLIKTPSAVQRPSHCKHGAIDVHDKSPYVFGARMRPVIDNIFMFSYLSKCGNKTDTVLLTSSPLSNVERVDGPGPLLGPDALRCNSLPRIANCPSACSNEHGRLRIDDVVIFIALSTNKTPDLDRAAAQLQDFCTSQSSSLEFQFL